MIQQTPQVRNKSTAPSAADGWVPAQFFTALLGLAVVIFSLLLIRAESLLAVAIAVVVIGGAGTLFWFLVKSMARIQMPARPGAR